jgi:ABC-type glycerol-3-phosphate transport system substrate-binding protein
LFTSREAAYLVTGPWSLPRLRAALPPEEIAVALLPSGPRDRAAPVLEVEGFMINSSATPAAVAGGLAFARYVTSAQGAEDLLTTGLHVPANVTVDLSATPVIDQLSDQAHLAQGVIQDAAWRDVARLGDSLYESVVSGAMDVADAAAAFMQAAGALEAAGDAD